MGSWINFAIGRFLGKRFVRRWIPAAKLERFNRLLKRQGIIVLLILFIFPGFPKDYLCLFLGLTAIPRNVFLVIASIGRMPGTRGESMPAAAQRSRKSRNSSVSKKNWVIARAAPASSLRLSPARMVGMGSRRITSSAMGAGAKLRNSATISASDVSGLFETPQYGADGDVTPQAGNDPRG